MKKTVAALALAVSSSAFALLPMETESKTYCLDSYESSTGAKYVGSCDQSYNNKRPSIGLEEIELLENGCAEDQVALTTTKLPGGEWLINIGSCLPPNVVQL